MIFIFLYCREKAHDNKNSVVKIQNLDMSQESEAIKSNPGALKLVEMKNPMFWGNWHPRNQCATI